MPVSLTSIMLKYFHKEEWEDIYGADIYGK